MPRILLVEDDLSFSQLLQNFLGKHGYETTPYASVKAAIASLQASEYELMLLDYRLPDGRGTDVLRNARESNRDIPAIIMTSFNDVRTAVQAIRMGAYDYITKPVNPDELLMVIEDAMRNGRGRVQAAAAGDYVPGKSAVSARLYEHIGLVAPTELSVIIQGESGTGKEHVARAIHRQSARAGKAFVALDCGALSGELAASELFGHVKGAFTSAMADKTGLFESAAGGTIFLDEVGNLDYSIQVKLLRAIQERLIQPVGSTRSIAVDVRIIAATNDDLLNSVKAGGFREDLYHRLNEFKIQVPPLRARGDDLLLFTDHFIQTANAELGRNVQSLSPEVTAIVKRYDWPGNLRELKNVIRRMVLLSPGDTAGVGALPEEMIQAVSSPVSAASDPGLKAMNEANERALIIETLASVKYNKTMAARLLNIDRKTLYSKIGKYNIS